MNHLVDETSYRAQFSPQIVYLGHRYSICLHEIKEKQQIFSTEKQQHTKEMLITFA